MAMAAGLTQINGVLIPHTFSPALREGMSIPLLLHYEKSDGVKDDSRIGHAFLYGSGPAKDSSGDAGG